MRLRALGLARPVLGKRAGDRALGRVTGRYRRLMQSVLTGIGFMARWRNRIRLLARSFEPPQATAIQIGHSTNSV
jgi:hypothetical protein